MAKYKNIKTTYDGHKFDSLKEYGRYLELKGLALTGEITNLTLQPKFDFIIPGWNKDKRIFRYIADFQYYPRGKDFPVIEDVKGVKTAVYRLKKKLIEAQFGIEIVEV